VKVMNLANSEKESIPSEKVLRAQFNEDYMWNSYSSVLL
jgi:hypothetical protein